MHDPSTLAFSIKSPFRKPLRMKDGKALGWYRISIIDIWHVDPCKGAGGDDSCGWFKRAHHGSPAMLEKIEKALELDWDRTFTSDGSGKTYACGFFLPNGHPHLSVHAIVLNLFFIAAGAYFDSDGSRNWNKSRRWMRKHLFDILIFAENPTDSLHDGITMKFGDDSLGKTESEVKRHRKERIHQMAVCIYGWILRAEQRWWQHPRWHFWHWQFQVHGIANLKRWAFSRCCKCGGRFRWGYSVCTNSWHGTGPLWFRTEQDVYHSDCATGQQNVGS